MRGSRSSRATPLACSHVPVRGVQAAGRRGVRGPSRPEAGFQLSRLASVLRAALAFPTPIVVSISPRGGGPSDPRGGVPLGLL